MSSSSHITPFSATECIYSSPDVQKMIASNKKVALCNQVESDYHTSCPNFDHSVECNNNRCKGQVFRVIRNSESMVYTKSNDKGIGVYAKQDIEAQELIMEYVGELIDGQEKDKRIQKYIASGHHTNFMEKFQNREVYVDATDPLHSNMARFINHSCSPNSLCHEYLVKGEMRMGIVSEYDILKDEEITISYGNGYKSLNNHYIMCLCGAYSCSGVIGVRGITPDILREIVQQQRSEERKDVMREFQIQEHQPMDTDDHNDVAVFTVADGWVEDHRDILDALKERRCIINHLESSSSGRPFKTGAFKTDKSLVDHLIKYHVEFTRIMYQKKDIIGLNLVVNSGQKSKLN